MIMKRVMCLYRVSTRGQVDKQDDIPMQRRECQEFINRRDDWVFVGERMEKGISGYLGCCVACLPKADAALQWA